MWWWNITSLFEYLAFGKNPELMEIFSGLELSANILRFWVGCFSDACNTEMTQSPSGFMLDFMKHRAEARRALHSSLKAFTGAADDHCCVCLVTNPLASS